MTESPRDVLIRNYHWLVSYVDDADGPHQVRSSPQGFVTFHFDPGPLRPGFEVKSGTRDECHEFVIDRLLATLAAAGYAVVPVEPTKAMIAEGMSVIYDTHPVEIWGVMLAAAPKP